MNVIVSNRFQNQLNALPIDVIKSVNGEFSPEEITEMFANFFYNKMILDVTAIRGYQNVANIQKLAVGIDMSKVILVLDDSDVTGSPQYLSQLISMGIYNFTRNIDNIPFLIDNPNTYKDVAQYHNLNNTEGTNPVEFDSFTGTGSGGLRIIGFKNVTEHAGATTLIYMLKKHLEVAYNVVAIEVNNEDFRYLNDKSLKTSSDVDLSFNISNNPEAEVILLDLNDSMHTDLCNEVIYLIEPGLIKLNKLIRNDREAFERLKEKKIVLNKSILTSKDINDFEREANSKIFFSIPYLDDKKEHEPVLDDFLLALGFSRLNGSNSNKAKLFNIFK